MMTAEAAVVDADGTFGTHATVWFSGSLNECKAFAQRSHSVIIVYGCNKPIKSQITKHALQTMTRAGIWKTMR